MRLWQHFAFLVVLFRRRPHTAFSWNMDIIPRRNQVNVRQWPSSLNCLNGQSNDRPCLAVITEPNTCDSDEQMNASFAAIEAAVSTKLVWLVSIRTNKAQNSALVQNDRELRVKALTRQILTLKQKYAFHLVVSSDWVDTLDASMGVGVHVKESHRFMIPEIRRNLGQNVFIGTSAHSLESAINAVSFYSPNYLFVGTCYATESHPEKGLADLEGPSLPGQVAQGIRMLTGAAPIVLAIGGIDEANCWEPVGEFGADGVAVIRAVLQASNPAAAVRRMHNNMQTSKHIRKG